MLLQVWTRHPGGPLDPYVHGRHCDRAGWCKSPNAAVFARAMLSEVVDVYPVGSSVIKAYVTLTFTPPCPCTCGIDGGGRL